MSAPPVTERGAAVVVVRVLPLWALRWLVARTSQAHALVDGRDEAVPWDRQVHHPVRTGIVEVEAYARSIRSTPLVRVVPSARRVAAERRARLRVRLEAGDEAHVTFRQGWVTGAPFVPLLTGAGEQWRFDHHLGCFVRSR